MRDDSPYTLIAPLPQIVLYIKKNSIPNNGPKKTRGFSPIKKFKFLKNPKPISAQDLQLPPYKTYKFAELSYAGQWVVLPKYLVKSFGPSKMWLWWICIYDRKCEFDTFFLKNQVQVILNIHRGMSTGRYWFVLVGTGQALLQNILKKSNALNLSKKRDPKYYSGDILWKKTYS